MKKLLCAVSVFVSLSAFASQEIYDSFNAEELILPSSRLELIYLKSAGGVNCTKTKSFEAEATYECHAKAEKFDSELVYGLLNVEEVLIPSNRLVVKHQKKIGSLTCVKTSLIDEEINYKCSVKL